MLNMNQTNIKAIVNHNFNEVIEITCECCGKKAIVAHLEDLCTHCQLEQQEVVNGTLYSEDYAEFLAIGIGKEEAVNFDALMTRLKFGDKFVIRMNSKFYGWQWKAAKLFEKGFEYAREFETFEQAEKIAKKYVNQCTEYQILTISQAMSM